nr:MAG TPA: hypothetical protein [Caudoviricetes sp.]
MNLWKYFILNFIENYPISYALHLFLPHKQLIRN